MERRKMSLAEMFMENNGTSGMWATIVLKDGLQFEGTVVDERPHGVYLLIGGDSNRLNLFPWDKVSRVVYASNE
jgi:hypothetical protein